MRVECWVAATHLYSRVGTGTSSRLSRLPGTAYARPPTHATVLLFSRSWTWARVSGMCREVSHACLSPLL
jgi:hypothetical protein